ncbi:MAG: CHAD domain-containing protein [Terriglobia bacterium]
MATENLNSGKTELPTGNLEATEGFEDFAWVKARRLAVGHLDRIVRLEPKVLRGDHPRAVHDFRVASRRAQQVLDLLAPSLAEMRPLHRRIQRCRRALSKVRDGDVLIQRIEQRLARKRPAQKGIWEAVLECARDRRKEAGEKARRKFSKTNLAQTYVRLKQLLEPLPADRPPGSTPASGANEFNTRLAAELGRAWSRFEERYAQSLRAPRAENIHQVRIAVKKVRYLVEVMKEFDIPGCEEALAWLKKVQRLLGRWHDCEVTEQMMVRAVSRAGFIREHLELASSILKLISRNRSTKTRLWEEFPGVALGSETGQQVAAWAKSVIDLQVAGEAEAARSGGKTASELSRGHTARSRTLLLGQT